MKSALYHTGHSVDQIRRLGPEAVLYAVLDAVDGYTPVVTGLRNDIEAPDA
jgi:hypothetical protein